MIHNLYTNKLLLLRLGRIIDSSLLAQVHAGMFLFVVSCCCSCFCCWSLFHNPYRLLNDRVRENPFRAFQIDRQFSFCLSFPIFVLSSLPSIVDIQFGKPLISIQGLICLQSVHYAFCVSYNLSTFVLYFSAWDTCFWDFSVFLLLLSIFLSFSISFVDYLYHTFKLFTTFRCWILI